MISKIIEKDRGFARIRREMKLLRKKPHVKAGWMGGGIHKGAKGSTVVQVAVVHEFGSPEKNIPQRSVIRSTFDEKKDVWSTKTKRLKKLILSGHMTVSRALDILGTTLERDQKAKIRNQDPNWPKLLPETIKRKESTKKLIDTAQMMNSIKHKKVMSK